MNLPASTTFAAALVLAATVSSVAIAGDATPLPSRDAALFAPDQAPALRDPDPAVPTLTVPRADAPRPQAANGRLGDDATFCNVFLNESERETTQATGFC